ncbi:sulfotransferase [Geoglobus acetivorans]|uniref:Sulfotransferase n=1 Tax=Geoglobus acetivorans TaxID=565033 RepID=A0ABZ3H3P9_GEOAI|nr:sulfotransferase [Geoglobus acetivorans]
MEVDSPVFIVTIYRTGSTLLRNILDRSRFVAMAPEELHLWNPYPWRQDAVTLCKKFGKIREKKKLEKLVEVLFSKKLYGAFWKKIDRYGISKDRVLSRASQILKQSGEVSCMDVVNLVLLDYLERTDKPIFGGKNPVYATNIEFLENHYPDCKVLLLFRDPRAVYLSKTNDEFSRWLKGRLPRPLHHVYDFITLLRVSIEYRWLYRTCVKNRHRDNVRVVKYEDLLSNPVPMLKAVCRFIGVPFESGMLYTTGKESSIENVRRRGIDSRGAHLWRKRIKPWECMLIDALLGDVMSDLGYGKCRTC